MSLWSNKEFVCICDIKYCAAPRAPLVVETCQTDTLPHSFVALDVIADSRYAPVLHVVDAEKDQDNNIFAGVEEGY